MIEGKGYKVIYADPPWYFRNFSAKGTGRAAISHYNVMSLEQLHDLDVSRFAAKDCALFMWAIDPMLPQALSVMEAWGFAYKTVAFQWVKVNRGGSSKPVEADPFFTGLGYWTRANAELCLLGTRGKPKRQSKAVRRLLVSERREHSRKPDEAYERIEQLLDGPYLELFAREARAGWDAVGHDLDAGAAKYARRQPSRIASDTEVCGVVKATYAAK
ncbi:MAG: MT-A70 family methyltransferase [Pseudomonadota bacterium]